MRQGKWLLFAFGLLWEVAEQVGGLSWLVECLDALEQLQSE
jgi:hypothetical protein